MITFMRRYRRGLQIGLIAVIAAFVASLFITGNMGPDDGGRDWVAKVNGEAIPLTRYQQRYQNYFETYSQMYRGSFTPEFAEKMGLERQVLDDLVQEAIVVQRARAEGLEVGDAELNAQIHAIPAMQEGGRFSMKRYQDFLKRRGSTAATFEAEVRRQLTRVKVENLVKAGIKISDAEIERTYALQREQIRAAWALVELQPLVTAQTVTDDEIQKHLKDHEAQFKQAQRRRVQYVILSAKDFTKPVPDAEVDKYYKEHPAEFEAPREIRLAHVLVRVSPTGGSDAEDKAKARVADVIKRAKAGEDFAQLAKTVSEDPGTKETGGELGFIKKGEVVPEFEKVAFEMKKGDLTPEPVRTPFGFHAIKILDVREGGKKPFAEVAPKLKERLATENADRAVKARADELKPALQAAPDFMAKAKELGLTPVESNIPKLDAPVGAPKGESMEEVAFTLAIGGVSAPIKTPIGVVVMKAIEHLPAAVPPLAEIREQLTQAVKRQKAELVAAERAKQLAADSKSDFAAAAKKASAQTGETPPFSRVKPAAKLPGSVMLAALQTTVNGVTEPIKSPQGFYVLKVIERAPGDVADLDKERDKMRSDLLSQKQAQAWETWIASLRTNSKIELSPQVQARRS